MTRPLTLFEHQIADPQVVSWTAADTARLERLQRALGREELLRPVVRAGQVTIQATQYVGLIRLGERTIQILPKMHRADAPGPDAVQSATRNLLHLLAYTLRVPIHEQAVTPLLRQETDWFEILTGLFTQHLIEEWQRGAHRGYQAVDSDLPMLKGQWRVAEQIRRPATAHRFVVTYDEFSADNRLNRIFRYVVERLAARTRHAGNARRLGLLRQMMDEITLLPLATVTDAAPSLITRLNVRYAPLLNLARLFLAQEAPQLAADRLDAFAFVFDMNKVFEDFIAEFIRRHRATILPSAWQGCDLLVQTSDAARHLATREGGQEVFRLLPDLAFRLDGTFPLLLDTKYKRLDSSDTKLGVAQGDFYQMYTYAQRYACPHVLLLYPQTADQAIPLRGEFIIDLAGRDGVITAATVDLRGDLGTIAARQGLAAELRSIIGDLNHG
jgi:5-methylcytosine-specific restriction enzyme subunit McrC